MVSKAQGGKKERSSSIKSFFGLNLSRTYLSTATVARGFNVDHEGAVGQVFFLGEQKNLADFIKGEASGLFDWQKEVVENAKTEVLAFHGEQGPIWLLKAQLVNRDATHEGLISESGYGKARDLVGCLVDRWKEQKLEHVWINFVDANEQEKLGGLVGIEMGFYRYKEVRAEAEVFTPVLHLVGVSDDHVEDAGILASGINIARHLVNVPPCDLNPKSYSEIVKKMFAGSASMKVDIWDEEKIKKERMGLLHAVGKAAEQKPCMVHLKYRPKRRASKRKPVAFVGKGVTFDSGGLDIKPSDGMRLMKKDMGGSAALVGLAWWLEHSQAEMPCDIYLALAENAIAGNAFRPGDIVRSRQGHMVEIHNTDAEGRLIMADAIDVAINQKGEDEPEMVIDIATLTGAIKVALGSELFGLFANDDVLAGLLIQAAQTYGERGWRMPLFRDYHAHLVSAAADFANASNNRFGGAISAALFLQKFVSKKTWAHLDIYAWSDRIAGACSEVGANGQGVQCLVGLVKSLK